MLHEKIKMVFSAPPRLCGSISLWGASPTIRVDPCLSVVPIFMIGIGLGRMGLMGLIGPRRIGHWHASPSRQYLPALHPRAMPLNGQPCLPLAHPCPFVCIRGSQSEVGENVPPAEARRRGVFHTATYPARKFVVARPSWSGNSGLEALIRVGCGWCLAW